MKCVDGHTKAYRTGINFQIQQWTGFMMNKVKLKRGKKVLR